MVANGHGNGNETNLDLVFGAVTFAPPPLWIYIRIRIYIYINRCISICALASQSAQFICRTVRSQLPVTWRDVQAVFAIFLIFIYLFYSRFPCACFPSAVFLLCFFFAFWLELHLAYFRGKFQLGVVKTGHLLYWLMMKIILFDVF